uniref:Putative transcription factor tfiiib component b n=1 Tax=Nyssomyia neivai TaxID=330878 RepID=A0A1L8DFL4_9DIPT
MSFRRPRVKASANLVLKRPTKSQKKSEKHEDDEDETPAVREELLRSPRKSVKDVSTANDTPKEDVQLETIIAKEEAAIKETSAVPEPPVDGNTEEQEEVFKSPDPMPIVSRVDASGDVDKEVPIGSLSPTKMRQRIKPTPFFGSLRRNSTHESEDEGRRQRNSIMPESQSMASPQINPMPRGPFPGTMSRIRTESTCSTVSDVSQARDKRRPQEPSKINELKRELSHRLASGKLSDRSRLTMYDMIYYNPSSNPMKYPAKKDKNKSTPERRSSVSSVLSVASQKSTKSEPEVAEKPPPVEEVKVKEETVMPVPQLKLGPNGEMILDEKSLVIETTGDREARETLAHASIVYDDEFSSNNGFYRRQARTKDWSDSETIIFYKCLHTIGTDFSLMGTLFTDRSRRDLKLKFKKEERMNLGLINKALMYPKTFDLEELRAELAKAAEEAANASAAAKKAAVAQLKKDRKKERKVNFSNKKRPTKSVSRTQRLMSDSTYAYKMEEILSKRSSRKRLISETEDSPKKSIKLNTTEEVQESEDDVIPEKTLKENPLKQDTIVEAVSPENEIIEEAVSPENEIIEETEGIFGDENDPVDMDVEEEEWIDSSQNDLQDLDLNNLVIVKELKDGETMYKIHLKNPKTDEVSDKPLDLPQEIINSIVSAHLFSQAD